MKLKVFSSSDVKGKRVLVRVDFNVPLKNGGPSDNTRILAHKETVGALLDTGASVALASHLGRPKGKTVPEMSLSHVAEAASEVFERPVIFSSRCTGAGVEEKMKELPGGAVLLLENLRFHPEEEKNDEDFARLLAKPFEVFVMDAFSASHRANSSTSAIMDCLPSYAGFLLQKEVEMLSAVSGTPEKPFVLILGGAKVSDKIGVVEHLMDKATSILVGGGMAFTFLKAQGGSIGNSLFEEERSEFARDMIKMAEDRGVELLLPVDTVAAAAVDAASDAMVVPAGEIPDGLMGLDIGPETAALFAEKAAAAKTLLWNGPMGVFENPLFAEGTKRVAEGVALCTGRGGITVVGGGDTAAAAKQLGFAQDVSHVSTGGGASLEFCEGKSLPGIAPLINDSHQN